MQFHRPDYITKIALCVSVKPIASRRWMYIFVLLVDNINQQFVRFSLGITRHGIHGILSIEHPYLYKFIACRYWTRQTDVKIR